MTNVFLPKNGSNSVREAVHHLLLKHGTFVATFLEQDEWFVRISAQIYNDLGDFERMGKAMLVALHL